MWNSLPETFGLLLQFWLQLLDWVPERVLDHFVDRLGFGAFYDQLGLASSQLQIPLVGLYFAQIQVHLVPPESGMVDLSFLELRQTDSSGFH